MENALLNESTSDNIFNIDTSKLSDKQISKIKEQLDQEEFRRFKKETIEELSFLKNNDKKKSEILNEQNIKINEHDTRITKQEKIISVIGFGPNSKKGKILRGICCSRVYSLLGDKSSVNFIVWQSYFFKKIYADIANHFEVDGYKNINIENFEEAKELGYNWVPEDWYLKKKLEEMKKARDMGQLKPERCIALTVYLQNTNNGEINPFC
ncbi:conserved protein of unknown function [Ruminococcaceae bacterium BL-6]|nr:conserved protein of unknown function [Ruminococcaceae bacterium BL-6]